MLTNGNDFPVFRCKKENLDLVVLSPKRLAEATWRPIPQFTHANISKIFPRVPNLPILRLSVFPKLLDDGKAALTNIWDDSNDVSQFPDTFTVIALGREADAKGDKVADTFLRTVFAWLRIWSKQWWIGRGAEALSGNLHFTVPVLANGNSIQFEPRPMIRGLATTLPEKSMVVDEELWERACTKARDGIEPNISDSIIPDLRYYISHNEHVTAIILLCS